MTSKLYFYYSTMNAGKSTVLLQTNYNYKERGMETLILSPAIDSRSGDKKVTSRIGLQADAVAFDFNDNLCELIKASLLDKSINCVFVDEAQFLACDQVKQLSNVVDMLKIPVRCYGLRTDFRGNLFSGSQQLLAWADELTEIKTICHCGRKANMVLRIDDLGNVVKMGEQIQIGGNDSYVPVCRLHFKEDRISELDKLKFVYES